MADNENSNSNNDSNKLSGEGGKNRSSQQNAKGDLGSQAESNRIAGTREMKAKDGNEPSVGDESSRDRASEQA